MYPAYESFKTGMWNKSVIERCLLLESLLYGSLTVLQVLDLDLFDLEQEKF